MSGRLISHDEFRDFERAFDRADDRGEDLFLWCDRNVREFFPNLSENQRKQLEQAKIAKSSSLYFQILHQFTHDP